MRASPPSNAKYTPMSYLEVAVDLTSAIALKVVIFLAIVLLGWFVGTWIHRWVRSLLTRVGFDRAVERGGVNRILDGADATDLTVHVHHFPPGTSKWNKIEHRLFYHITQNWRGKPLMDRIAIVELIGATTTKTGLKVDCVLDTRTYEKGIKITKAEMASLAITGDAFHPEWSAE